MPRRYLIMLLALSCSAVSCSPDGEDRSGESFDTGTSVQFDVRYPVDLSNTRRAEVDDESVQAWHRAVEPILVKSGLRPLTLVYWRDIATGSNDIGTLVAIHGNERGECDLMLVAYPAADAVPDEEATNPANCDALPTSEPTVRSGSTQDGSLRIVVADWRGGDDADSIIMAVLRVDGEAILRAAR